jgi:hypothetical protein
LGASPARKPTEDLEDEAREVVEVEGRLAPGPDGAREFTIEMKVQRGFHVYAHVPGQKDVVPTALASVLGRLVDARYPEGEADAQGLKTYRGKVRLEGRIEMPKIGAPSLELTYQACDESRCLPPVSRLVRLE